MDLMLWVLPPLKLRLENDYSYGVINVNITLKFILQPCTPKPYKHLLHLGREPWSSGYGWWLMFERSWVRIPAKYTGWTFFTLICCKNCIVCLKRPKKRPGLAHFLFLKLCLSIPSLAFFFSLWINIQMNSTT